jgi:hypothetical protein
MPSFDQPQMLGSGELTRGHRPCRLCPPRPVESSSLIHVIITTNDFSLSSHKYAFLQIDPSIVGNLVQALYTGLLLEFQ